MRLLFHHSNRNTASPALIPIKSHIKLSTNCQAASIRVCKNTKSGIYEPVFNASEMVSSRKSYLIEVDYVLSLTTHMSLGDEARIFMLI